MNNKFLLFAESLKLVRKADIEKDDVNVINEVYTDLLPNNGIITKFNLPRTTILIGRKGTGKSTIIQKSMFDISNDNSIIGIYIDIKTLYDSATPKLMLDDRTLSMNDEITKYLIYKNFLLEIIRKTKSSFANSLKDMSLIKRAGGTLTGNYEKVENELDKIEKSIDDVFQNIDLSLLNSIKNSVEGNSKTSIGAKLNITEKPDISFSAQSDNFKSFKSEFQSTMLRYLDIKKCLVDNFNNIKKIIKFKYIYIYLDDYSEIDEKAQEIFTEWIIAPLNNLSDNFIKFKIAVYPNRFYYGKLDIQKLDIINLDFYKALSTYKSISRMEEVAIDYTRRLIENRFKIYLPEYTVSDFFDINENELYSLLFDVSINIPRKLGFVLSFCYECSNTCNTKIDKDMIASSSKRYFEEITTKYFESSQYVSRSYDDIVSIETQRSLIVKIIEKQIMNKNQNWIKKDKRIKLNHPPTSHFMVRNDLVSLLETLELNGYISTYYKTEDKNNVPSTIYSMDYGLCQMYNLYYNRPKDNNLRKYYNDSRFSFDTLIKEHYNKNQTIICEKGHEFSFDMLKELEKFSMVCPECLKDKVVSTCHVEISSNDILDKMKEYENKVIVLDDDLEYELLYFLFSKKSKQSFSATDIARELDCSWQLVVNRANNLIAKRLICLDKAKKGEKRYYKVCENAEQLLAATLNKNFEIDI